MGRPCLSVTAAGLGAPEGRKSTLRLFSSPCLPPHSLSPESYIKQIANTWPQAVGGTMTWRSLPLNNQGLCLPSSCSACQEHLSSQALHLTWASRLPFRGTFGPALYPTLPHTAEGLGGPGGTYSASWSWGSARPRRRRSRECGRRHCQSIHFLLEAHR